MARQYKTDKKIFEFTAKQWTENFAKEITNDDKIKKLAEMGFPTEHCKEALERYDWDEERALNFLLSM